MVETHNATDGESAGYPDPAAYQGCQEARETRRAYFDDQCKCRSTCRLWTRRNESGYAVRCMTWRRHYLCFTEPCEHHIPEAQ